MDLHQFLAAADAAGYLITVDREVDPYLEIARLAAEVDGRPVLFTRVKGSAFPVVAGVCSDRRYFGLALGVPPEQVIFRLAEALTAPLSLAEHPERSRGGGPGAVEGCEAASRIKPHPFGGLRADEHAARSATTDENAAEHPERRAAARSRRMRSGLLARPHPFGGLRAGSSTASRVPSTALHFAQGRRDSARDARDLTGGAAPCQQIIEPAVDLEAIPFLTHYSQDGGAYASAAVAFINDPDTGPNASFHRLLRLDKRRLTARLVERRGTHAAWLKATAVGKPESAQADFAEVAAVSNRRVHAVSNRRAALPVAICIGLPTHVLLAASMAPPPGVDEMRIAAALAPTPMVETAHGIRVPAEAEFVLEGWITKELTDEGPFVDLTGTYDFIRQQPIIEIERITRRRDALYQALLPGRLEHKLLMGMPREPTIYAEVNQVARCCNVNITPGGASWLHAVVQIAKRAPDDGVRAIEAAFRGHGSLKHVWVVDEDVNPFDPHDVEWAMATRFQADRGLVVLTDQPSSSLDPSAHHVPGQKSRTAKLGIDATIHWDTPEGPSDPGAYRRV